MTQTHDHATDPGESSAGSDDPQAASSAVEKWLAAFDRALRAHDEDALRELFAEDCYWRDFVAFTWNLKTLEGIDEIAAMLQALSLIHI